MNKLTKDLRESLSSRSKEECTRVMHKVNKKNPSWQRLSTYKCKFCKGWHFGHTPRKVIRHISGRKSATKDITDYKKL